MNLNIGNSLRTKVLTTRAIPKRQERRTTMSYMCLFVILIVSFITLDICCASEADERKPNGSGPAVLICSWSKSGSLGVDLDYLAMLQERGFTVDYMSRRSELTWDRIKPFNVLVLYDFPNRGTVSTTPMGSPGHGPGFAETVDLLERFMAAGGGVLIDIQNVFNPDVYSAASEALGAWGAKLPMEEIIVPESNLIKNRRLGGLPFMYSENVVESPVSEGVNGFWYPQSLLHGGNHPYHLRSGPIEVDESWEVVLRAPKGSVSKPVTYENLPAPRHIPDLYQRTDGVEEPALFAIRDQGERGRLALFWCWPIFHFASGTSWMHDGVVLSKGFDKRPSDFGKLLENTLTWLAAPSLSGDELGGAVVDSNRLIPDNLREETLNRSLNKPLEDISLKSEPTPRPLFKGVVGPRTAYSGGKGTVADYAAVARQNGLSFVVFLEDFAELDPQELKQLTADCRALSDATLLLIPGYRMRTNLGNQTMFFGLDPEYPYDQVLTGPDKKLFKHQSVDDQGHFHRGTESLDFTLKYFPKNRHAGSGGSLNNVGFFDFKTPQKSGGLGLYDMRCFSAAGVLFYDDGKLVEDVTDEYLITNHGTMSCIPMCVNLVSSPKQLANMLQRDEGLTYAAATSLDRLWRESLNWQHQFKGLNVFPSTGPIIRQWGEINGRRSSYGAESFVTKEALLIRDLDVTSDVGLKEVSIYDGEILFRRFRPMGAKDFNVRLFLNAMVQKNLSVVAIDIDGGKAVSFPLRCWKHGTIAPVFCSDHVNDSRATNLHRGPMSPRFFDTPTMDSTGYTWDGGPSPVKALFPIGPDGRANFAVMTSDGKSQGALSQIPYLEFCDAKVLQCRSSATRTLDDNLRYGNPWNGYGPLSPAPLYDLETVYTEFDRYNTGVSRSDWPGLAAKGGTLDCLGRITATFKEDLSVREIRIIYNYRNQPREDTTGTPVLLLFGQDEMITFARDISLGNPSGGVSINIPKGGWFAAVSRHEGNAQLYVNYGDPLKLFVDQYRTQLSADLPTIPWEVKAGETYKAELFTMTWPYDDPVKDSAALLRRIRYLQNPDHLTITRGEREDGPIGLLRITPDDACIALTIRPPKDKLDVTLPFLVQGMNPRWTALMWQKKGYRDKENYGDGNNRFRELGINPAGEIYFPVYAAKARETIIEAGHPIIADEKGSALFIQVTCLRDREDSETGEPQWHISVNNPTDHEITTTVRAVMNLPGLDFKEKKLILKPGEYRVIRHADALPDL